MLDLEGNLASILVHLVKRNEAVTDMLDTSTDAQDAMNSVKERLHRYMRSNNDFTERNYKEVWHCVIILLKHRNVSVNERSVNDIFSSLCCTYLVNKDPNALVLPFQALLLILCPIAS